MGRFSKIFEIGMIVGALALPVFADAASQSGWDFDSIAATPEKPSSAYLAAQEIYFTSLGQIDRWNAHDMEGYLEVFEKSPTMVSVVDGDVTIGWQELHDHSVRSYHDPNSMGRCTFNRLCVRMTGPDTAYVLAYWTIVFGGSKHIVVGVDSSDVKKLGSSWKITSAHTSTIEM
jgi:uncharacterized protein (TIGR02246 family)